MLVSKYASEAIHWWSAENNVDDMVPRLVCFLFEYLDALHITICGFPDIWYQQHPGKMRVGGSYSLSWNFPAPKDFATLRSAIGLVGDIYCILKNFEKRNTSDLKEPINDLLNYLKEFRDIRNFFAHLDERLGNPDEHGITGAQNTEFGITYTETAKGCLHLVMVRNVLYFSEKKKAKKIDVSRSAFLRILELSKELYNVLTSHSTHSNHYNYPSVHDIYTI